jgi:hypothetical protein
VSAIASIRCLGRPAIDRALDASALAYVKQRGAQPTLIKTETIRPYRVRSNEVDELKDQLARTHGVALSVVPRLAHEVVRRLTSAPMQFVNWELALAGPCHKVSCIFASSLYS